MNTIEDRAYEWSLNEARTEGYDFSSLKEGYIKGARDQKSLDDEEYRKDMQYINAKKQELMDRIRKAYCTHHCPHLVEYCWQDEMEIPCGGLRVINKAMEE